jgi:ABC-2 type transport system ATP-binding protein
MAATETSAAVSVEVTNLSKWYGGFKALDGVSFKIRAGEIVGFLGPNGAGKTTTMKILTCFLGASGGSAKVAGFDVGEQSMEVRRRVGYLPETVPLYKDMLVYDYLRFVAEMRGVASDQIQRSLKDTAEVCGLSNQRMRQPISELSKGYRQRVGLAQALIHKPEVVILDEPTSGLDPNQIIEIRDLIKEIGKEKTIIFSTHILQEVSAVCDRILILNEGKLLADGTVAQLEAQVRKEELLTLTLGAGSKPLPSAEELAERLRGTGALTLVEPLPSGQGEASFLVHAKTSTDPRKGLFELAAQGGLSLLALHRQPMDLEEIFRAYTGDASRVAAESRERARARVAHANPKE